MGAYLSEPITDKVSTDKVGKRLICGASSMQGWRVTQEDAHNCTLEYDTDTSFFAVYDGHGGHEVAAYSAQHLPQYLKNCEAYKKGDYAQALKDAFLEFDATLTTPEVLAVLKQIAKNKEGGQNSGSDEEEENVKNLYEEAEMPLEQVMAKYQNDLLNPSVKKIKQDGGKPPVSPFLRGRRACSSGASCSGSGSSSSGSVATCSVSGSSSKCTVNVASETISGGTESDPSAEDKEKDRDAEVSSSVNQGQSCNSTNKSRQHLENNEADQTSDSSTSNGETNLVSEADDLEKANHKVTLPDSSEQAEAGNSSVKLIDEGDRKQEVNGEIVGKDQKESGQTTKDGDGVASSLTPHENGEVVKGETKGKSPRKISSSPETTKKDKRVPIGQYLASSLYHKLFRGPDECDSDSDDEGDESFQGADSSDDEDDDDAEEEEDDDDDDDDEEEEEDEDLLEEENEDEKEDEEDEDDFTMKMTEEPGSDSGCTAVVALLKGQELYVANAGDSRCVVCRKGQAVEMSLDHKPEDEAEMDRIVNAGGKVTADGRVNGGLNLSRALGDHAYKQSEGLSSQEQMITALPDVRTLMIDPAEDEFMILACDGIWNFMSSQEVVDFVRPRIQEAQTKLSQICEELFDHCLAPNTLGDGTGCDNMTAVIVQFQPERVNQNDGKPAKRSASPDMETSSDTTKRPKIEETPCV